MNGFFGKLSLIGTPVPMDLWQALVSLYTLLHVRPDVCAWPPRTECNDYTEQTLGLLKKHQHRWQHHINHKSHPFGHKTFVHMNWTVCYWYLATKRQEKAWKTSKAVWSEEFKEGQECFKCASLETSCEPVCLNEDLHLVIMTPSDDGWNKMVSRSPQNGLNKNTLEVAKMQCPKLKSNYEPKGRDVVSGWLLIPTLMAYLHLQLIREAFLSSCSQEHGSSLR